METGQMSIMQMLGANVTAATSAPPTAPAPQLEGEQKDEGSFAGILMGMSPPASSQQIIVPDATKVLTLNTSVSIEETASTVPSPVQSDLLAILLASAGNEVKMPPSDTNVSDESRDVSSEQKSLDTQMPQIEAMNAAGAQIALALQIVGRMPETDQKLDKQVVETGIGSSALNGVDTSKNIQNPIQEVRTTSVAEKAELKLQTVGTQYGQTRIEVPAQAPDGSQNIPQAKQDAEATEVLVARAAGNEMPDQQVMGTSPKSEETVVIQAASLPSATDTFSGNSAQATALDRQPLRKVNSNVSDNADSRPSNANVLTVKTVPAATSAPQQSRAAKSEAEPMTVEIEAQIQVPVVSQKPSQVHDDVETALVPAARTTEPVATKISSQQIMAAYSRPVVIVSNATSAAMPPEEYRPVEPVSVPMNAAISLTSVASDSSPVATPVDAPDEKPLVQSVDAPRAVKADVAACTIVEVEVPTTQPRRAQGATQMPVLAAMPEPIKSADTTSSVKQAIESGVVPTRPVVKIAAGSAVIQEERLQQQTPAATAEKTVSIGDNVLTVALKAVSSATSGEKAWSDDKHVSDQGMNGLVNQALQQQMKTENAAASGSAAAPAQNPANGVSEHVAKQVSEHLANHEVKNGSEQIVLRLSPEHLGELKVNMRMENQRLTVEIVTENRMVRDALIQNSDTLKDSLAKQNIKMDSFDVSTGGNNSGGGRGHNDWRELAQNRQSLQWQQLGGYNVPNVVIPTKLAYNPQAEYGMVDVHF